MSTPLLDSLQRGFDALPPALVEAQGLGTARRGALAQALADGLPGPRSERWKYTALRALAARSFNTTADVAAVDAVALMAAIADIPAPRLVFVNGRANAALSLLEALPAGLQVQPLAQALAGDNPRAVRVLGRIFARADEVFARFNAALATDGALVRVDPDAEVAVPLHLVFLGAPAEADLATHSRHLIELRERATLTVVEHHRGVGAHKHLANHLLHAHLKPGSRLTHARVQAEGSGSSLLARTDAVLASDAVYRRVDLELGGALSRHELNVALQGDRAAVHANGALLAGGRGHVDTRLGIDHVARDTACDLRWRGLATGRGRVAFHGGILIRAGADGSNAQLSNKNLLLSEGAEIDAQPVLEIHADEVKAAHGATVGRLDDTALFYLRSRGLPEAQARALLTLAFCRETLAALDDAALAESLAPALEAALARLEIA